MTIAVFIVVSLYYINQGLVDAPAKNHIMARFEVGQIVKINPSRDLSEFQRKIRYIVLVVNEDNTYMIETTDEYKSKYRDVDENLLTEV